MALGSRDILTILSLPIHEHGVHFCLFVPSFISFLNILYFSMYKSFASLVKFIPKYFILFDATVNGIILLIPFSDCLLLVYRNATDFCMILDLAT